MSFIPKNIKNELEKNIDKKEKKSEIFEIADSNKNPYADMSNEELQEIDADVNQTRININSSIDNPIMKINEITDEVKYLEDINNYFNDNEQLKLVANGIKLTTAKEYKLKIGKNPLLRNKISNVFIDWLKKNHPEDIKFLTGSEINEEETKEKRIPYKQIMEHHEKKKQEIKAIDKIFSDNEQNELLNSGIRLTTAKEYNTETKKKPIWNGKITNKFEKWLKNNHPDEIEFLKENDDIKETIEEIKKEQKTKKEKDISGMFNHAKITSNPQPTIKTDLIPIETENEIIIEEPDSQEKRETYPIQRFEVERYPTETEIMFLIKRHKFVKENLLDKNDIATIKKKKFIKKSGWRKFINSFGISIELIEQKIYEKFDDKHAEIRVRAIAPNGQSVEGIGIKSWSELYDKTMHNLIANAWTRAVNRAVSDLVGYGEVSAEELSKTEHESDIF